MPRIMLGGKEQFNERSTLIWEQLKDVMEAMIYDCCDIWFGRNKVLEHREDGKLKGLVMYHEIENGVELEGVYFQDVQDKRAFFKLFRKATKGAKVIQTTTQKVNLKVRKTLENIGFKIISEDVANLTYRLERSY